MTKTQDYLIQERIYDGCGGSYWITSALPENPTPDQHTAIAQRLTHLANRAD